MPRGVEGQLKCGGSKILYIPLRVVQGSNVWLLKIQNGEYGGGDEPPKPQNFVRPSK